MRRAVSAAVRTLVVTAILAACGSDPRTPNDPDPDPDPSPDPEELPAEFKLGLQEVARGLIDPLFLTAPPGDNRLFVLEKEGRVRIIEGGQLLPTPFLDISSRVDTEFERGLLGLAFHPDYASNRRFYLNFTDLNGHTHIERFTASASNPNIADPGSASLLLVIEQPAANHNGGTILFGPDGYLYIGMGDGGGGGFTSQDRGSLLGDILRIDVNGSPYSVPSNNPFVGESGVRPEIWASGVRNPWRFSIDRATNLMYIGDVGQGRREEIDILPIGQGGKNLGWPITEGSLCHEPSDCSTSGITLPVFDYGRDEGCAVIGGYVYRGQALPELRGRYLYSDFCRGWLRSFRYLNGTVSEHRNWITPELGFTMSMGEDASGELYLLTYEGGFVYRIVRGNP